MPIHTTLRAFWRNPQSKKIRSWLSFPLMALAVYFGNVELQTYLGEKAWAETGIESPPFNDVLSLAAQENKLILADFSAVWCPSCRKLDKEVLSEPAVKSSINKQYIFTRIEYESDEGRALVEKYGIQGLPTLLVLDKQGRVQRRLVNTYDPEQFIQQL